MAMAAAAATSSILLPPHSSSNTVRGSHCLSFLHEFRGLKRIQMPSLVTSRISSSNSTLSRRLCTSRIVCEAQDTLVDLPTVTDATWQSRVLNADGPVVVEFWAPWCGPCRIIHPVVAEIAEQYAGKLKFYKLNTDESPSTATKYGIRSVPTILIFLNGEKKDSVLGAVPKATLTTAIDKFL